MLGLEHGLELDTVLGISEEDELGIGSAVGLAELRLPDWGHAWIGPGTSTAATSTLSCNSPRRSSHLFNAMRLERKVSFS